MYILCCELSCGDCTRRNKIPQFVSALRLSITCRKQTPCRHDAANMTHPRATILGLGIRVESFCDFVCVVFYFKCCWARVLYLYPCNQCPRPQPRNNYVISVFNTYCNHCLCCLIYCDFYAIPVTAQGYPQSCALR